MKKEITEAQLKALWHQLKNKGEFAASVSEELKNSRFTIAKHWFSDLPLSGNMPSDYDTRATLLKRLQEAPKKKQIA